MAKKQKTYSIWALGCQMNTSDAERLESILINWGYAKATQEDEADLIVVVACSVRQHAMDRINGKFRLWQKRRDKGELFTILSGCVVEADRKKLAEKFDLIIPISDISQIPRYLAKLHPLDVKDYFHIQPAHGSSFQAYVPIMTGCNNFCSYCVVPYTRGREVSRPAKDIIKECQNLIAKGYKEIILLGQNVNSYSSELLPLTKGEAGREYNFPQLLKEIDAIEGDWWLRFITSHPKDLSDDLINAIADGQHTTPYLHLAVQSGDKDILSAMNRKYTPEHYLELIQKVKKLIPHAMISTDIIVGFPGESEDQFLNTVKLMESVEFDMAYLAEYSKRVGTAAAKLIDNVPKSDKRRRKDELTALLAKTALKHNQKLIGGEVRVLVEGCKKDGKCYGKTDTFRTAVFEGNKELIGQFVMVKIESVDSWGLFGSIVN